MSTVKTSVYLVIEPQHNWQGAVESIKVDRTTQTPPRLRSKEIAVKLVLSIDRNVFEQFLPVVNVDLSDPRTFLTPEVEVETPSTPEPPEGDDDDDESGYEGP